MTAVRNICAQNYYALRQSGTLKKNVIM